MSSNTGNHSSGKAGHGTAGDPDQEKGTPIEVHITDKRRLTSEGDPLRGADDPVATADPADPPSVDIDQAAEVEELQMRLKETEEKKTEAERQVRDFAERFRHAQAQLKAETEEQRARMQRNFDQKLESARGEIIAGLLDTLDNLRRAVAAAEKSEHGEADFTALLDGVKATAGLFETRMMSMGLKPVQSIGEVFDPEIHEAVEIVPVPADQDNRVIEEYQTGYKFGEKLLRPARVRVGRGK